MGNKVVKEERLSCETYWEIDEKKVSIKNKFGDKNFDWGTFKEVLETGEHFLITYSVNKNMFQIVPKRSFLSDQQQNQFRKILEEKICPIKTIRSINLPDLSRGATFLILCGFLFILIIITIVYNFIKY
jgi:hypothetical protein